MVFRHLWEKGRGRERGKKDLSASHKSYAWAAWPPVTYAEAA